MDKNFCTAPWIGTTFETTGDFKPCCYIDADKIGLRTANSFDEYYNGQPIKDLRKQFMEGKKPDACKRCWLAEGNDETSLDSMRRKINRLAEGEQLIDKIFEITSSTGEVNESIVAWADLQYSNKCNYSCIICSPWRSKSIEKKFLKEYRILAEYSKYINLDNDNENKILHWLETEGYKTIKLLAINGGEPFLQPGLYKMLDIFINKGADTQCKLAITTNGSINKSPQGKDVITDYLRKWNNEIIITMSIDHCGEKGEFLRPGFTENIWLDNYYRFSKESNISLRTSIALSLLNAPTIHELFDMFSKKLIPNTINHINIVHHPESISFGQILLDPDLLKKSLDSFDKSIEILKKFSPGNIGLIQSAKNSLINNFKANSYWLPHFREGIKVFTERREVDFLTLFPEHKNFLEMSKNSGPYPKPNLL